MVRVKGIGSLDNAKKFAKLAAEKIPAYKKFLASHGKTGDEPFEELPCTTKKNYMTQYPYEDLLPDKVSKNISIFSSSGSSGKEPFYWAYRKEQLDVNRFVEYILISLYSVNKKSTLVIDALALGSWVGGDFVSFALKSIAIRVDYPITVITTGTHIDEILLVISKFGKHFDQIMLATDPTVFSHVILSAEHGKIDLPYEKMRYLFFEEGFTEDFRIALQKKAKAPETEAVAYSLFASADTGTMGLESAPSVALRKLCFQNRQFSEYMGIKPDFPHFFHTTAEDAYIETIEDEMCVTRWTGVPIIRYNLRDQVYLYSWAKIQEAVKNYQFTKPNEQKLAEMILSASPKLPDIITFFGRADSSLTFGGTKLFEYMFNDVMKSVELSKLVTGVYKAKISYQDIHSYIDLTVELKENVKGDAKTVDEIENLFEAKLADISPEFRSDYEKLKSSRETALKMKFVKVTTVPWPTFSQKTETVIKLRGITPTDS